MSLERIADKKIKPCKGVQVYTHTDGDVQDIISQILKEVSYSIQDTKDFAKNLRASTEMQTLKNVWRFVKSNVRYQRDKQGHEVINSAGCTWHRRRFGSDCKSFTTLISSLLHNLGFRYYIEVIFQDRLEQGQGHIYNVVVLSNGKKIIVDAVDDLFNRKHQFWKRSRFGPYGKGRTNIGAIGDSSFWENIIIGTVATAAATLIVSQIQLKKCND